MPLAFATGDERLHETRMKDGVGGTAIDGRRQLSWTLSRTNVPAAKGASIPWMGEASLSGCDDCGQAEDRCRCELYVYDGAQGRFEACFDANFDFDTVMSRISGAYRVERD